MPDLRPGAGGGRGESERAGLRPFPVPPRRATENIVGKVTKERFFSGFIYPPFIDKFFEIMSPLWRLSYACFINTVFT